MNKNVRVSRTPIPEPRRPRMGPRPLPMFLALEGWTFLNSYAGSTLLRNGSPLSKAHLAESDRHALEALPRNDLADAVEEEARRRFGRFLHGVQLYRDHPYRRRLKDPDACWSRGAVTLRDYGGPSGGIPILAVPSLINRSYVLDLNGERSLMRQLARRGFRPFLVDWGWPGEEEMTFDLTDYVTERLEPALDAVLARTGRRPVVLGYCMGGLMALALCLRRQSDAAAFIALATPWNFHADDSNQMRTIMAMRQGIAGMVTSVGELPVDLLQMLFAGLDPQSIARKFRAFGLLPRDSAKAKMFVALEDWVNDGVPLAPRVAQECLLGWYGDNTPFLGNWRIDGKAVDPGALDIPALAIIPSLDRIVPPQSAEALADALPRVERVTVPLGHIGMVVGGSAPKQVYGPMMKWMRGQVGH